MPAAAGMDRYMEGLSLYGDGKFVEAIEAFERGIEERPDWADCLQAKGMAQLHAGRLQDAVRTLQRAAELAPEDPSVFTSLSMVWVRLENIEEAEKAQATARMLAWKEELKTNPNAPPPTGGGPPPPGQ